MSILVMAAFWILVYVLVDDVAEGQIGGKK
jgi:hypothetical protein